MSYRDARSALEARCEQLREDLAVVRQQLPQAEALVRRERELASELASIEARLAGKPPRRRPRGCVLALVALAVAVASGVGWLWLSLRPRAPAVCSVPTDAPPEPAPPPPDCRVLAPQEVLQQGEPGLVAEHVLSGGVAGYDSRLKLYDDYRVVTTSRMGTRSSAVLKDDTTRQLVALAGSLGPDVSPPVSNCPSPQSDPMWGGTLFHGRGARAPTEAERAKISQLVEALRRKVWPRFPD